MSDLMRRIVRFAAFLATTGIYVVAVYIAYQNSVRLGLGNHGSGPVQSVQAAVNEYIPFLVACVASVLFALQINVFRTVRVQLLIASAVFAGVSLWVTIQPIAYSLDIFRYLWNGHLLVNHVSPYTYIPIDPHLARYTDWPFWYKVGWKKWPEAYPPLAQVYFYVSALIGDGHTIQLKLMVWLNQCVSLFLFYRLLCLRRLQQSGVSRLADIDVQVFTLFALLPPVLFELLGAGHVDAFVIPWLLLAWIWSLKKQPARLGLALAAATAVKVYPLVLIPAFLTSRSKKFVFTFGLVFIAVLVVIYLPFLTPKLEVFAFFEKSANLFYGSGFQFWFGKSINHIPHGATIVMGGLELLAWLLVLFTKARHYSVEKKVCILGFTFLLASPMIRPWYPIPFFPFAVVAGDFAILWFTVTVHAFYALSYYPYFVQYLYVEYIPTYILALYQWLIGWRRALRKSSQ